MIDLIKEMFLQVAISSAKVSIIVILLLVLTKLIEERYSAGFRYYSWLAVIIVFLIPFHSIGLSYKVDMPRFDLYLQSEAQEMPEEISETEKRELSHVPKHDESVEETIIVQNRRVDIVFLAALIWSLGVVLYFGLHIKRYYFFKKTVKRFSFSLSDTRIEKILAEEKKRLKISEKLPVRISPVADTPFLTGLFQVMLILPNNDYTDDELHFILRHELIHHKRKDIWYQFLTLIFVSLHWFNPFVYLMARAIEIDGETSCDEAVLSRNPYETRISYGEMLIAFLKTGTQKKSYFTTTFFGGEKAMKKRLTLIASRKIRKSGIGAMIVLTIITILISVTAAASTIEFVDSKDMVKNSSNRENTVIMDTGEGYDVFIGCEPIYVSDDSIQVPLKTFIVFIDYQIISEETGESITISNGNRQIKLSTNSNLAKVNDETALLKRAILYENDEFYLYIDDIEALFSYKVFYDLEKNNVVLTVTDETPEAVKTLTPPEPLSENYVAPPKVTVLTQGEAPTIFIDNTPIIFPDAQPFIDQENRTQVPVRAFTEKLNCKVDWDEESRCVLITGRDNAIITLTIGDKRLFVNGNIINMDTAPSVINGRTYVPLYFLSQALKINVFWEE